MLDGEPHTVKNWSNWQRLLELIEKDEVRKRNGISVKDDGVHQSCEGSAISGSSAVTSARIVDLPALVPESQVGINLYSGIIPGASLKSLKYSTSLRQNDKLCTGRSNFSVIEQTQTGVDRRYSEEYQHHETCQQDIYSNTVLDSSRSDSNLSTGLYSEVGQSKRGFVDVVSSCASSSLDSESEVDFNFSPSNSGQPSLEDTSNPSQIKRSMETNNFTTESDDSYFPYENLGAEPLTRREAVSIALEDISVSYQVPRRAADGYRELISAIASVDKPFDYRTM
ncbi:hypothetical protein RUND412_006930 [Rhizina undulata]